MRGVESRHPPGLVVMLTGDLSRYTDSVISITSLDVPIGSGLFWFKGCLISDGLNKSLARVFDRDDLEWAWIMGDDHNPPPDMLMRLLDRDVDVIVPVCLHRAPPFPTTVVDRRTKTRSKMLYDLPTTGLYKLQPGESCGDAGMLIRRRVLEAIPRPWYDNRRSGSFSSDDQAFTTRLIEAGFDVHIDCDVRLGHITPMAITPTVVDGEWRVGIQANDRPVVNLVQRPATK